MMKRIRLKIWDVFAIPLPDGRFGYGQYVFRDQKKGYLIQVFEQITEEIFPLEKIDTASLKFPPVFVGLLPVIRSGRWEIIGNLPIKDFKYPLFVSPLADYKNKKVIYWTVWDGNEYKKVGYPLPSQYRGLEQLVVWHPEDIAERLQTGINTNDYIFGW